MTDAEVDELIRQVSDLRERAEAVARGIAWLARRVDDAPAVPPSLRTRPDAAS